jgi:hypothetical protein
MVRRNRIHHWKICSQDTVLSTKPPTASSRLGGSGCTISSSIGADRHSSETPQQFGKYLAPCPGRLLLDAVAHARMDWRKTTWFLQTKRCTRKQGRAQMAILFCQWVLNSDVLLGLNGYTSILIKSVYMMLTYSTIWATPRWFCILANDSVNVRTSLYSFHIGLLGNYVPWEKKLPLILIKKI